MCSNLIIFLHCFALLSARYWSRHPRRGGVPALVSHDVPLCTAIPFYHRLLIWHLYERSTSVPRELRHDDSKRLHTAWITPYSNPFPFSRVIEGCQKTQSAKVQGRIAIRLLDMPNGLCPMGKKPPRAALKIVLVQSCRYSESSSTLNVPQAFVTYLEIAKAQADSTWQIKGVWAIYIAYRLDLAKMGI